MSPGLLVTLVFIPLVVYFLVLPAARISVNRGSRSQGMATSCRSNLKNIATALEMYSADAQGRYPRSLGAVVRGYLKQLPTCPAGGETYADGYCAAANPDRFTVVCTGLHHEDVGWSTNYPQYNSTTGPSER